MHSAADGPRSAADVCWLSGALPRLQQACRYSCPNSPCNAGGLGDLKPSGVITSPNFGQFAGAVHLFGQPDCGTKLQAESKSYAKLIQDQLIGMPNHARLALPVQPISTRQQVTLTIFWQLSQLALSAGAWESCSVSCSAATTQAQSQPQVSMMVLRLPGESPTVER